MRQDVVVDGISGQKPAAVARGGLGYTHGEAGVIAARAVAPNRENSQPSLKVVL